MSDAVELNSDVPERVNRETVELSGETVVNVKNGFEVSSINGQESSKNAPQLDTLVPSITNPKTV